MSFQTTPDIPLLISSPASNSERRVNPTWTLAHFKRRLEPITGIPVACQRLVLRSGHNDGGDDGGRDSGDVAIEAEDGDEEGVTLERWGLEAYAEIYVHDTRGPTTTTLPSTNDVEKYTLPPNTYASLPNTVLSYKRTHKLGRFDPDAPSLVAAQVAHISREVEERGIVVGRRCRLVSAQPASGDVKEDDRRGTIAYVGPIPQIPGPGGASWVGVRLDEPVGKNDGSVGGVRYFAAGDEDGGQQEEGGKSGVFVRPERVEVGDFKVEELGEEWEEM